MTDKESDAKNQVDEVHKHSAASTKLQGFVVDRFVQSKMTKVCQMVAECRHSPRYSQFRLASSGQSRTSWRRATRLWTTAAREGCKFVKQSERQGRCRNIGKNAMFTKDSNSYARIKDTYSTSCCTSMLARGRVTRFTGVTVNSDVEQHREAHSRMCHPTQRHDRLQRRGSHNSFDPQLVSDVTEADSVSLQPYSCGVDFARSQQHEFRVETRLDSHEVQSKGSDHGLDQPVAKQSVPVSFAGQRDRRGVLGHTHKYTSQNTPQDDHASRHNSTRARELAHSSGLTRQDNHGTLQPLPRKAVGGSQHSAPRCTSLH